MTRHIPTRPRALTALIATLAICASLLTSSPALAAQSAPADTATQTVADAFAAVAPLADSASALSADIDGFDPGYIISDEKFTDSSTMTAAQIDAFLKSKVSTCVSGYTCLKDYRQATATRAKDTYCNGYTAGSNESAATIIYKVSVSCGINPQVFLVMLEKEQGLISHTWPSKWRYDAALGQGCPDTAPCDSAFAGLFNQIYGAGRQMKIYMEGRYFTYYAPGNTWNILYNPNASCGRGPVTIKNKATSALYYYTPYQPNAAALAAGYGEGNSCSAYGNRNFYLHFKNWFGQPNTGTTIGSAITQVYNANGGAAGWIGKSSAAVQNWGSGASQRFQNADIYVKTGKAGWIVGGAIRTEYRLVGEVASGLGWPTGPQIAENKGAYQEFENGRIYQRPDGKAYAIGVPMYTKYVELKGTGGVAGWPAGRAVSGSGGSKQVFDKARFYQARGGKTATSLSTAWATWYETKAGGLSGPLGVPTVGETTVAGATRVTFASGLAFKIKTTYLTVSGKRYPAYAKAGSNTGLLGLPTSAEKVANGVTSQTFSGGTIYTTSSGTNVVSRLSAAHKAGGGVSKLGYPVAAMVGSGSSYSQKFSNATLTITPEGKTGSVRGVIGSHYDSLGGAKSFLKAATGGERTTSSGVLQRFEGGAIVCSPVAVVALPTLVTSAWEAGGGAKGPLGWPLTGVTVVGGVSQVQFQKGVLTVSADNTVRIVQAPLFSAWNSAGGSSILGAPTAAMTKETAGTVQLFDRGSLYSVASGATFAVTGKISTEFVGVGGTAVLGFPTMNPATAGSGTIQRFATGSIGSTSAGTYAVRGTMLTLHNGAGSFTGPLGYPTAREQPLGAGAIQYFSGGLAYVSPYALAVTRGMMHTEYGRRGGPTGSLGWPLGNERSVGGGAEQTFQNGTLVLSSNGTFSIRP